MMLYCSFLLLFALDIAAEKVCESTPECKCFGTLSEPQYSCNAGFEITVTPRFQRVELTCVPQGVSTTANISWNTAHLPPLDVGNITVFDVKACSLPTTFSKVLNDLKIGSLKSLSVSYSNDFENVTYDILEGISNLNKLMLAKNNIKYIDRNSFNDITTLTELDLTWNKVQLEDYMFQKLKQLKHLTLARNELTDLPDNVFENLTSLMYLYLQSNNIKFIGNQTFRNLISLETLELSYNQIESISEGSFDGLVNLKRVNLGRNVIKNIPWNLFQKCSNLELVKIFDNDFSTTPLPDYFLSNLTNLIDISVESCKLRNLPEHLFSGSVSLEKISLKKNYLESLPERLFQDLNNLKTLDLSFNNLSDLSVELFQPLTSLKNLDLSHNNIQNLNNSLFKKFFFLEVLHLDHNRLVKIDSSIFKDMEKLKELTMSNNYLTLEKSWSKALISMSFFSTSLFGLNVNLEIIDLSHNNITVFDSDLILYKTHLKEVNLSYNQLSNVNFANIFATDSEFIIDLSHNNITNVNFSMAEFIVQQQSDRTISIATWENKPSVVLRLDYNPIHCDCFLYDLARYFDRSIDPLVPNFVTIEANNLVCAWPPNFRGFTVTAIRPHMVKCTLEQLDLEPCSDICDCSFRPWDRALIVNCENRNLTKVPKLILPTATINSGIYNHTVVNLKNNLLRSGPTSGMGYDNVTELELSFNQISKLSWIPPQLENLKLDNNNISYVDKDMLIKLNSTKLSSIVLGGNPYICDCSMMPFSKHLVSYFSTKTIDVSNIKCRNGGMTLIDYNDLCPVSTAGVYTICIVVVIVTILILIIISMVFYHRYEHEIHVWLYKHHLLQCFIKEEEVDKNKVYDAFISYSHKDEDFVEKKLKSVLEEGPFPYKLCLHVRDWIPGKAISKQIIESVEKSRRTIVILSPHFLESVWGTMEFQTAHVQAIKEGMARVIVILYGDIDVNAHLDNELKAYIKTNTYLKWGDPWFWDKLRYALPHSRSRYEKRRSQRSQNLALALDDKLKFLERKELPISETTPPALEVLDPQLLKNHPVNFTTTENLTPPAESGLNPLIVKSKKAI